MTFGFQFRKDIARAHDAVLDVGPGLAGEGQGFLHVEGDDLRAPELEEEIAEGADGDRLRGAFLLGRVALGVAGVDLRLRLGHEGVDEVVGLHAQALAAGDLDRSLVPGDRVAEGPRGGGGEHHLLVGQVMAGRRRLRPGQRRDSGLHDPLWVGLADVDHVVHGGRMAEDRRGSESRFGLR